MFTDLNSSLPLTACTLLPMSDKRRISPEAMIEVETAMKAYFDAVEASDLTQSSQASYIDPTKQFLRWLRGEFDPGSRKAPYIKKK